MVTTPNPPAGGEFARARAWTRPTTANRTGKRPPASPPINAKGALWAGACPLPGLGQTPALIALAERLRKSDGTLHLLGYDHEDETEAAAMEAVEIGILSALGIDNPYATAPMKRSA